MIYTNANHETLKKAADVLTELFPKLEVEPTYSKGFQKWMLLSKKKKLALASMHGYSSTNAIKYLNENL